MKKANYALSRVFLAKVNFCSFLGNLFFIPLEGIGLQRKEYEEYHLGRLENMQ
jgi:hypothetical protein